MRSFWISATLLITSGARAEPPRIAAVAIAGGWLTGHSNDERHGGAEVDIERDLGDVYRIGAGAELYEFVIHDDECYGSSGQQGGVFMSGGLHEPTAKTVHFFVVGRVGIRGTREVPSCYPVSPVRYDYFSYLGLASGVDIGAGSPRVRVQLSAARGWALHSLTEFAIDAGGSFLDRAGFAQVHGAAGAQDQAVSSRSDGPSIFTVWH